MSTSCASERAAVRVELIKTMTCFRASQWRYSHSLCALRDPRIHMREPAINRHRRGVTLVRGSALVVMLLAVGLVCRWLAAPAVVTDRPPTRIGRKIEQGR